MTRTLHYMVPITVTGRASDADVTPMDLIGGLEEALDAAARDPDALRKAAVLTDAPDRSRWVLRSLETPGTIQTREGRWVAVTPDTLEYGDTWTGEKAAGAALPSGTCWCRVSEMMDPVVPAEIHSDDDRILGVANAAPWLAQASATEIRSLAACGWRGDYPADDVAHWLETIGDPTARALFSYLETRPTTIGGETVGFEVAVEEGPARSWLRRNRTDILGMPEGPAP